MFGLWYSIVGLVFGVLCSFKAKEKNRAQQDWFTLGFVFSILALGLLYILPDSNAEAEETETNKADEINFSLTT